MERGLYAERLGLQVLPPKENSEKSCAVIKLYYAGGTVEVGDEVAEAVMDYAHDVVDVGKSDLVTIPVISENGTRGVVRLQLGPSSEPMASPVGDNNIDLTAPPLLTNLRDKTV